MDKIEAIEQLKRRADAVKAMGATSLYLFGSAAQDHARQGSDLDLFTDYGPEGRFNAFDLVGIKQFLETNWVWKWTSPPMTVSTRCCAPTSNNRRCVFSNATQSRACP